MRVRVVNVVVAAGWVAMLAVVGSCAGSGSQEQPRPVTSVACEEDEPCWDCTTMGNRICGSTSPVLNWNESQVTVVPK